MGIIKGCFRPCGREPVNSGIAPLTRSSAAPPIMESCACEALTNTGPVRILSIDTHPWRVASLQDQPLLSQISPNSLTPLTWLGEGAYGRVELCRVAVPVHAEPQAEAVQDCHDAHLGQHPNASTPDAATRPSSSLLGCRPSPGGVSIISHNERLTTAEQDEDAKDQDADDSDMPLPPLLPSASPRAEEAAARPNRFSVARLLPSRDQPLLQSSTTPHADSVTSSRKRRQVGGALAVCSSFPLFGSRQQSSVQRSQSQPHGADSKNASAVGTPNTAAGPVVANSAAIGAAAVRTSTPASVTATSTSIALSSIVGAAWAHNAPSTNTSLVGASQELLATRSTGLSPEHGARPVSASSTASLAYSNELVVAVKRLEYRDRGQGGGGNGAGGKGRGPSRARLSRMQAIEMLQLSRCRECPFIVRVFGCVDDPQPAPLQHRAGASPEAPRGGVAASPPSPLRTRQSSGSRSCRIVMEWAEGGDLGSLLQTLSARRGPCMDPSRERLLMSEASARFYVACLLEALTFLHTRGLLHRDVKPANLLISSDGRAKLGDLGMVCHLDKEGCAAGRAGTPNYMAPEVWAYGSGPKYQSYGVTVDLWSVGVVLHELLTGHLPGAHPDEYLRPSWRFTPRHPAFSPELRDLLSRLLSVKPRRRPQSCAQVAAHPWFAGFNWQALRDGTLPAPYVPAAHRPPSSGSGNLPRPRSYYSSASTAAASMRRAVGCSSSGLGGGAELLMPPLLEECGGGPGKMTSGADTEAKSNAVPVMGGSSSRRVMRSLTQGSGTRLVDSGGMADGAAARGPVRSSVQAATAAAVLTSASQGSDLWSRPSCPASPQAMRLSSAAAGGPPSHVADSSPANSFVLTRSASTWSSVAAAAARGTSAAAAEHGAAAVRPQRGSFDVPVAVGRLVGGGEHHHSNGVGMRVAGRYGSNNSSNCSAINEGGLGLLAAAAAMVSGHASPAAPSSWHGEANLCSSPAWSLGSATVCRFLGHSAPTSAAESTAATTATVPTTSIAATRGLTTHSNLTASNRSGDYPSNGAAGACPCPACSRGEAAASGLPCMCRHSGQGLRRGSLEASTESNTAAAAAAGAAPWPLALLGCGPFGRTWMGGRPPSRRDVPAAPVHGGDSKQPRVPRVPGGSRGFPGNTLGPGPVAAGGGAAAPPAVAFSLVPALSSLQHHMLGLRPVLGLGLGLGPMVGRAGTWVQRRLADAATAAEAVPEQLQTVLAAMAAAVGAGGGSSSGQKGTPTSSGRDTATTSTRNQHPGVRPACMANVVAASQAQETEASSLRTQPSEPSSLRVHRRSPSVDLISSNPIADTDMATCMGAEDLGTARLVPAVTIALAGSMSPRPLPARHGHRRNRSSPSGCTSSLDTATAVGAAPSTLANIRGYASMRHPLADEEGAEGEVVRPGAPEGGSTQGPAACSRSSSLASESVDPQGQAALSQAPSLTVHELTTIEQAEWEQATGVVVVRTVTAHASGGSSSAATRTDGGCAVSSKAGPQDRALPPVKGRLPAESSGTDFPSFHPPQPQPEPEPRPCHRPSDSFCTDMPTASGSQNHAKGHNNPSHTTSTSAYSRRSQRSHSFSFDVEGLLPAQGRGSPAAMVDHGNNSSSGSVAAAPRLASTAAAAAAMAHGATRGGRSGTEVHAAAASLRSMAAASTGDGRPPLYRLKPSGRQSQRMAHLEAVAGADRDGREDGWLDEGSAEARSSTACSPEAQRRRLLTSEDVILRVYAMCVTVLMALLAVAWMAPRWQLNGWQM